MVSCLVIIALWSSVANATNTEMKSVAIIYSSIRQHSFELLNTVKVSKC